MKAAVVRMVLSSSFQRERYSVKAVIAFALVLSLLAGGTAHADTSKHVVRLACVPAAGLLHLETDYLHDSVAVDPANQAGRDAVLAQAGFYDAHALSVTCELGAATYVISTKQDVVSERMCGGDPEIYLTVKRNGQLVLDDVPFGQTCNQIPSVKRMVVGDGPNAWRGREMQVCYATGRSTAVGFEPDYCDWTFGAPAQFEQRFPVDRARIEKIVTHTERR